MKLNVYLSKYSAHKASELHALDHDALLKATHLTPAEWPTNEGYTLVGTAEAQVTLFPPAECISRQVASLRSEQTKLRAESEAAVTRIEKQINSLLAIENGGQA